MALAYLVDPENQFMTKAGTINVEGYLRVYDAATDDPAITYCNFVGTENPEQIVLDNNGRAVVIADSERAYRLEVYNRYGTLLWTTTPLWCMSSGGGVQGSDIISTDGSISVDKTTVGSMTTFDIGLAPQSDEFLEWCKCGEENIANGTWYPTVLEGTMESQVGTGLHVNKGQLYHITTTIKVDPTGAGVNYDTLSANLMFNDGEEHNVVRRNYDVDSSVNDPTLCEFSYDFIPDNDGYIYLSVEGVAYFEHVSVEMQVHRIYSGINAVPDTCATKQWVQETFDYNMSSKVDYSAIEHNTYGEVTGISGSAIAGGLNSATVSAIASSYAESAASSKVDQSAFDNCCSAMSGYVSALQTDMSSISASVSAVTGQTGNYIDWSASGTFQPSGSYVSASDMSSYIPFSGLDGTGNVITSISGSSIGSTSVGHEYTGIWPVVVDNTADTIAVLNKSLCVDETMTGYESAGSAVIGVNTGTVLSGLTAYQTVAGMSAYAYESSLSAKLDTTAFSTVSGDFLTSHQSLAGYATESYVDSSMSSKLDATASSQFLTSLPADLAYKSDVASAVSSKLDASASSEFYPSTSNPAGYLTAHQSLAGYATEQYVDSSVSSKLDSSAYDSAWFQPSSGMSAYAYASSLSGKLDASASSQFVTSLAGYATEAYVDSSVSSKLDATASSQFITSTAGLQPAGDYAYNSALAGYIPTSESGNYQQVTGMSAYIPTSESSNYQLTADMTAYQPVGTYIYESALGWAEV